MRYILLTFILLSQLQRISASPNQSVATDPVASAMGNTVHCSAHFANPALSTDERETSFYLDFHNEYGLKELCTFEGSLLLPATWAAQSAHLRHFGFEKYSLSSLGYGLGKRLSQRWTIGTAARLQWLEVAECPENSVCLYADVGATCSLTPHISVGALVRNVAGAEISSSENDGTKEELTTIAHASVWFLDNARWCVEVATTDGEEYEARNGFECRLGRLALRCGFSLLPIIPTLGCGFDLEWLTLDASTYYHNQLGYSFAIGLGHKF